LNELKLSASTVRWLAGSIYSKYCLVISLVSRVVMQLSAIARMICRLDSTVEMNTIFININIVLMNIRQERTPAFLVAGCRKPMEYPVVIMHYSVN